MTFCLNDLLMDKTVLAKFGLLFNSVYGISWKYSCWFSLAKHLSAENSFLPWNTWEFWISTASSYIPLKCKCLRCGLDKSALSPYWQVMAETIRNLMNTDCVVPDWLHDIILGYGTQVVHIIPKCPTDCYPWFQWYISLHWTFKNQLSWA